VPEQKAQPSRRGQHDTELARGQAQVRQAALAHHRGIAGRLQIERVGQRIAVVAQAPSEVRADDQRSHARDGNERVAARSRSYERWRQHEPHDDRYQRAFGPRQGSERKDEPERRAALGGGLAVHVEREHERVRGERCEQRRFQAAHRPRSHRRTPDQRQQCDGAERALIGQNALEQRPGRGEQTRAAERAQHLHECRKGHGQPRTERS